MAAAAKKVEATAQQAEPTGPIMKVRKNELFQKIMQRDSARSRTAKLAEQYHGKPVAEFLAAWEAEQKAGKIHHDGSKFSQGTNKAAETPKGWLNWFRRNGMIVIED